MSNEIIKVLDNLAQKFGIAIDWTNQNVMPYLEDLIGRFITLRNVQAIICIILSIVILSLSIWLLIKLIKWRKSDEYDEYDGYLIWGFGLTGMIFSIIIFFIVLMCNIEGLMQNIFVPEITILNYIKSLM